MRIEIIIGILILAVASCGDPKVNTKLEEEKIKQNIKDWTALLTHDSLEGILSYWAEDAIIMMPGQPPVKGKKAIREMVTNSRTIPGFKIVWEPPIEVTVSKSGDMAYVQQRNQITMNDSAGKAVTQYNKAIIIWRKQTDGLWKDAVDIWNEDPTRQH